ncbi:hypothetical protein [Flavobacterium pectinovorum]|uniref:Uncharacterized protein n=1 Tax=Flavobacterium pectinovorum TaxID=29533 RepID=A0A502EYA8_9FLAO|nr:hypothetical protein [Flavobacterium pectinovorum]TPG42004.1 hypothetical protein EAH81_06680 [Flavobacterium pectinovorum]
MSEYSIGKKILLRDVEEISISEEKVLVRGADQIIKEVDKNSFGGSSAISVTKFELDNLIRNNALIPGSYYIVSGVHPALYDDGTSNGTTIYIRAATNNKLEKNGHGEFWNPRYDQSVDGFGIYGTKLAETATFERSNIFATGVPTYGSTNSLHANSSGVLFASGNDGRIARIETNGTVSILVSGLTPQYTGLPFVIKNDDCLYAIPAIPNKPFKILKIDSNGNVSDFCTLSLSSANMFKDRDENILIWSYHDNVIKSVDNFGNEQHFANVVNPVDVRQNNNGDIVVLKGDGTVVQLDSTGTETLICTFPYLARNLYIDGLDNIFATATEGDVTQNSIKHVYRFLNGGSSVEQIWSGTKFPWFLAGDSQNVLYISTHYTDSIIKITLDLEISVIDRTDEGNTWNTIHLDKDNNLYIHCENSMILRYLSAKTLYDKILVPQVSYIVQPFDIGETITANNGAKGKLVTNYNDTNISPVKFEIISGNWISATGIQGDNSGALASIKNVTLAPAYQSGDQAIWGGYQWLNSTGNTGYYYNDFQLNEDWSKLQYNDDNYNQSLDVIEYDYENDWISRRYEVESGSDVVYSKIDNTDMGYYSAISSFQFGNKFSDSYYKGLLNIEVNHAYFNNVNFIGEHLKYITLNQNSSISSTTWALDCYIQSLSMNQKSFMGNSIFAENSYIVNVELKLGSNINSINIPKYSGLELLVIETYASIVQVGMLIFNNNISKIIYNRPDGTPKIRYYDNDDNLVINDITD